VASFDSWSQQEDGEQALENRLKLVSPQQEYHLLRNSWPVRNKSTKKHDQVCSSCSSRLRTKAPEVKNLGSTSLAGRFSCSACIWQLLFCLLEGFSLCIVLLFLRASHPCDKEAACFKPSRAISWPR